MIWVLFANGAAHTSCCDGCDSRCRSLKVFTTTAGLPVSTTHAIVGSLVQAVQIPQLVQSGSMPAMIVVQSLPILRIFRGSTEECSVASPTFGLSLNQLHWFTRGATSLARGMNDAPKIVALVFAASALLPNPSVLTLPAAALLRIMIYAGLR